MSLQSIFNKVAHSYDQLNHIMTLGFDIIWRKKIPSLIGNNGLTIDLCCGTGELSKELIKKCNSSTIIGIDFSKIMINKAKFKARHINRSKGCRSKTDFIVADVVHLPIKDSCSNHIGISFSFRNLIFRNNFSEKYIKEIIRVLVKNGEFIILESSQPTNRILKSIIHFYLLKILPIIGGLVSGFRPAYRYLGFSARYFYSKEEVSDLLYKCGFSSVRFYALTFGIVALHLCRK